MCICVYIFIYVHRCLQVHVCVCVCVYAFGYQKSRAGISLSFSSLYLFKTGVSHCSINSPPQPHAMPSYNMGAKNPNASLHAVWQLLPTQPSPVPLTPPYSTNMLCILIILTPSVTVLSLSFHISNILLLTFMSVSPDKLTYNGNYGTSLLTGLFLLT